MRIAIGVARCHSLHVAAARKSAGTARGTTCPDGPARRPGPLTARAPPRISAPRPLGLRMFPDMRRAVVALACRSHELSCAICELSCARWAYAMSLYNILDKWAMFGAPSA